MSFSEHEAPETPEEGLALFDRVLDQPDRYTGKPYDLVAALGETAVMAADVQRFVHAEMANVPPSVQRALVLLSMAVGVLGTAVRQLTREASGDDGQRDPTLSRT